MKIELPEYIDKVIRMLEAQGFEAYVVGGCVRDSLLSRIPQDWDITTNALPHEINLVFSAYRVLETGVKHGTVTVILDGEHTEITTFRIDGDYSDNRRPDSINFTGKIETDLARRDFTINALTYNPRCGILDCFGGVEDLNNRRITCVGNAELRFSEDALRILRAVRFASTLGFSIEHKTETAMNSLAFLLGNISVERVASELCRTLTGESAAKVLHKYPTMFIQIIPELKPLIGFKQQTEYHHLDCWLHTIEAVAAAPNELVLRLTMLFHDIGKPKCFTVDERGNGHFYGHANTSAEIADEILRRLKFDNATRSEVVYLIKHHCDLVIPDNKHLKRMLNKMGEARLRKLLMIKRADCAAQAPEFRVTRVQNLNIIESKLDEIIMQEQTFSLKDLAINGNDLIASGFTEGKIIGETLQTILNLVIDDSLQNDRNILLDYVKKICNSK